MIFQLKKYFAIIVFLISLLSTGSLVAQDEEFIERKPKYASKEHKGHRNKMDLRGKRWGSWKFFARDGTLILEIEYHNGVRHGRYARYSVSTGKMMEEAYYYHGKRDGTIVKYYSSGEIRLEGNYELGRKTGTWTYYHNGTGTVRLTGEYIKGKKEGEWKVYDKKEALIKTYKYKKGVIDAPAPPPPAKKKDDKKDGKKGKKKKILKKKPEKK